MHISVKQLCRTALLLALCIASQFLKNTSVYITGSIVNAILIIAVLSGGFQSGAVISIIAPLTSWWITASPLMSALPLIVPCIMIGNLILIAAVSVSVRSRATWSLPVALASGSCIKALFLWFAIVKVVLTVFGPSSALPEKVLLTARTTFSLTQLLTAWIGSALAMLIWLPLKKYLARSAD